MGIRYTKSDAIPRLTAAQIAAWTTAAEGQLAYDLTNHALYFMNNLGAWAAV